MGGIYPIQISFAVTKKGYTRLSCQCETLVNYPYCDNITLQLQPVNAAINQPTDRNEYDGYGTPQCLSYRPTEQ
jgi:hypothetical protein